MINNPNGLPIVTGGFTEVNPRATDRPVPASLPPSSATFVAAARPEPVIIPAEAPTEAPAPAATVAAPAPPAAPLPTAASPAPAPAAPEAPLAPEVPAEVESAASIAARLAPSPLDSVPVPVPGPSAASIAARLALVADRLDPAPVDKIAVARAALIDAGLPTTVIDGVPPVGPGIVTKAATATASGAVAVAKGGWNLTKAAGRVTIGLKTLAVATVTALIGLADSLQGIDIVGTASKYLHVTVAPGDIMVVLSAIFALLRLVSTTSVFQSWRKVSPLGAGGSDSLVDDPEDK